MNVLRALVVMVALVTLASLPCVIAWMVVNADEMTDRAEAARRRLPKLRPGAPHARPIEEIAADLRRLSAALAERGGSEVRRASLRRARDESLKDACAALGIEEHLDDLDGLDLEIERVRVAGALQRAGLRIDDARRDPDRQGWQ